ncbi:MAG TPA: hypothetical protein VFF68_00480, partial [Anaerolineaceae bacterium]|nr:hypothetical protein [Anaerolineaceae bacterium]
MTRTRYWIVYSLLLLALAAGCAAPVQQSTSTVPAGSTPRPASPSPLFPTASDAGVCTVDTPCVDETTPTPGKAAETSAAPADQPISAQPTATPDQRLDPADWREWPIVPERVSDFARQVYQKGLEMGNDPRHFSKIGDCQAIREVLMGVYDKPGQYRLPEDQPYLADTIEHFAGSFNRDGQGVKGGFNAAAVLSPLWADPQACQPGETPMACEYRTYRPSIVIISLEVWWDGRTPDRYVEYMRRIIDFYLEKGVVPVLSTKADNVEGDHAINLATAQLAYEYDLPLWNWWRVAQALPNRGLDPGRPDGFHISYDAWTPRGRTALQSLDAVWRMLNDQSVPAAGPAVTATPAVTGTPGRAQSVVQRLEIELPAAPAEETGPAGWLLVGLGEREGEALNPAGAVQIGLVNAEEERVLPGGQALLGASADGRYLLAAEGSELALHDLAEEETLLLSTGLVTASPVPARWLAGGIAFLETPADGENEKPVLVWLPLDGSRRQTLDTGELTPGSIAGVTAAGVYWLEDCGAGCDPDGLWFSPLDGSLVQEAGTFRRPQVSP